MNSTTNRTTLFAAIATVALALMAPAFAAAAQTAEKVKAEGVIVKREGQSLTLSDLRGAEIVVALTSSTQVKEKKSNFLRRSKTFTIENLQRGLYVEVEGQKDASGRLQASQIRFKEDYMKMASSVESLILPVEARVTAAETRLSESEKNAQRLSGQIQEVSAISNAARGAAKTAQDSADLANTSVKETAEVAKNGIRLTNERISLLDDYDVKGSAAVNFAFGSAALTADAKSALDQIAEEAGRQKGFVIEVTGFASSDGNPEVNRRLSQRRADAVVAYLADTHSVPLRRIVMPLGFGDSKPVADNATLEGRKQNRRVEIKVLVSKGLGQPGQE